MARLLNNKLLFDSEHEYLVLRETRIPGLIVWNNKKGASGEIGAIASACRILKITPPEIIKLDKKSITHPLIREYQAYGVTSLLYRLKTYSCAILADEMGLGKSRESIVTANNITGRKLVICPASVRLQWQKEIALFDKTCQVIDPYVHSKIKKGKLFSECLTSDYIVTSYDLAAKIYETCFPTEPPQILILDEAHNLRGRGKDREGNKRTKAIKELSVPINFKLAVTGTPLWDRPKDLWMLFQILGVKLSAWDFDLRYCAGHINDFGGMENRGSSNEEELKLRLSYYMVRRTKKEVAKELPALTRSVEWLDPDENATKALYSSMANPGASSLSEALKATHEAKLDRAVEIAIEARQFILFTYRKEHARYLANAINEAGIKCHVITGEDSHKQRELIIETCKQQKAGLVATIDSIGTGVNLQNIATTGIMHALPWEPNKLLQAEARPHRIDTHEPFNWIYLAVRSSADEHVINTVVSKLETWQNIMGMTDSDKGLKDVLADSKLSVETERSVMREIFNSMQLNED